MVRAAWALILALFLLPAAGCSHVISNNSLKLIDTCLSFRAVRQDRESFNGRYLLVGGAIAGVRNFQSGGELEVVQFDLDCYGKPSKTAYSGGRFLAESPYFLDPMVYRKGLMVTMVGEVAGQKTGGLEEVSYAYPVLKVRELYLWAPNQIFPAGPTFHFGIVAGVEKTF